MNPNGNTIFSGLPIFPPQTPKFKIGDRVKCIDGGKRGAGWKLGEIFKIYSNTADSFGGYICWRKDQTSGGVYENSLELVIPPKPKPIKIDFAKMDSVVMEKQAKDEIIAVLKQHQHHVKLFDEWGLGEVIEYGKGMTFLFYGPPGTGKTWAAHCISKALGKEILQLGAAEIQSSEPGAANRNIQEAFKTAKEEKKILFIDECDSLITNRKDVGMVLGSEVNTLLTQIEKSEDVVILATNLIENLDPALERRISLIVEFPEPNYNQRLEIWKKLIPKKLPIEGEVVLDRLAEYKLTGGQIKNAVLQAARLALADEHPKVSLAHFDSAIKRIHGSKSLMGTASRYRQEMIMDVGKSPHVDVDVDVEKVVAEDKKNT